MQNITLRWGFFILSLILAHFWAATAIAKLLGVFQPVGLFLVGALWVWFGMPRANAWLVQRTPFGRVWAWIRN